MKTKYVPYQECEGRWSISLTDIPEETPSHAKVPAPKTKPKTENPVIADARKRVSETKTANPLIENAKKRAATQKMEVHHV